jgi:anti-sigma regulatory factor (Ser/Thr protein kinase)
MKPIKLKPRNPVAKATQSGAGRHVDKRHEWGKGEELFNRMLDEFHIQRVEDEEKDKVRSNLDKLTTQRRVKW